MTTQNSVQEIRTLVEQEVGPVFVEAILGGYGSARIRLAESDLESEFQPAAYGQLLFFDVQQRVFQIEQTHTEFRTVVRPNENRSAYHTETRFNDLLITVEAVADFNSRPRRAGFRSDLASDQVRFDIVGTESQRVFKIQPPNLSSADYKYLHILHGRLEGKEELGFVFAVFENEDHEYLPNPILLYQRHVVGTEQTETETIEEQGWF